MLISIIIPARNASKYLAGAIQSICKQEFADWELLIVDDGSTDNTVEIIHNFSIVNPRIRYITEDGKGVTNARIKGAQQAKGRYLFFMDADDTIPPHTMKSLVDTANETNADIVIGDIIHVENDKRKVSHYGDKSSSTGDSLFNWIIDNKTGFLWGKLIKKELFLSIPIQPLGVTFCEDYIQMLQISAKANIVEHCGRPTYEYYQRLESACNSLLSKEEFGHRFFVVIQYLQKLIESDCFDNFKTSRLKAMILYYGRLFLLVNGGWHTGDDYLKRNFESYLKNDDVINDKILKGHHRVLLTKIISYLPALCSIPYIYLLRHKYHRIK